MLYAILHNIRSLHNVGSIFRTADAAGVEKIYLCGITGTPPRKEIAKVALGAEQTVPWEYVRRTSDAIKKLKKQDVRIVALETPQPKLRVGTGQETKTSIDYRLARGTLVTARVPLALLVGNEVEGLPSVLLKHADTIIHIPMRGTKESLNVSVAFGIVVYHFIS